MLGACTPKQSRRFFSREAAAFCCIGFPQGGRLLHRLRCIHLEHRQNVVDDPAHGQAEGDAALLNGTLGIQDAAGVVEAVVGGRHINAVAGDAGRVILLGGDRKSTRLNSSHLKLSRMPSSA